jgi:hypothetical protein
MKKLVFFIAVVMLIGCAANTNRVPDGKTDADWEKDEAYCLKQSGKVTGFFAQTTPGMLVNFTGANKRYNQCLRELGWLE